MLEILAAPERVATRRNVYAQIWALHGVCLRALTYSYAGIIQIRFHGSARLFVAPSQPVSWLPVLSVGYQHAIATDLNAKLYQRMKPRTS